MITGYTKPLYFLPFDHRASYTSGLFKWKAPLNVEQMVSVARSKHVIYAAFEQAIADGVVPKNHLGILVDEEFGVDILRDAANKGYITAASVEKSGQEEFDFIYGKTLRSTSRPCSRHLPKCSCDTTRTDPRRSTRARSTG